MGLGNWLQRLRTRHERRVLVLGLAGAGKTSAIEWLAGRAAGAAGGAPSTSHNPPHPKSDVLVTERFTVTTVRGLPGLGGLELALWDVGGSDAARPYWRHYYTGAQAVLFVVDATSGHAGLALAASELAMAAADAQLAGVPVGVLLSKADAVGAAGRDALAAALRLDVALAGHPWAAFATSATRGDGLREALAFVAGASKPL